MESSKKARDKFLDAIFEIYFRQLDKPLHWFLRFIYASLGAFSLLLSTVFVVGSIDISRYVLDLAPNAPAFFVIGTSAFFGYLIARANTRHGRIRLYISGLLLPAV